MKYKRGTKVEVLNKREVPSGSWWRAEIISGNGHTYSVRYNAAPSGASELVERVPRKVIRPCPPSVQNPITLISGDVIEVFDKGSWKLAEVCCAVGRDYFSVRVLGSSRVFSAHRSDIRLRQCWKDNRWIVIEKGVNGRFQKRLSVQATSGSGRAENCEETTTSEEQPSNLMFIKVLKKTNFYKTERKRRRYLPEKVMQGESNRISGQEIRPRKPNVDDDDDDNQSFTASSGCSSCGSNEVAMFYSHPLSDAAMLEGDVLVDDAGSTGWSTF